MKVIMRTPVGIKDNVLKKLYTNKVCSQRRVEPRCEYIVADIPEASANLLFDLIQMGCVVERDVKNDLD